MYKEKLSEVIGVILCRLAKQKSSPFGLQERRTDESSRSHRINRKSLCGREMSEGSDAGNLPWRSHQQRGRTCKNAP